MIVNILWNIFQFFLTFMLIGVGIGLWRWFQASVEFSNIPEELIETRDFTKFREFVKGKLKKALLSLCGVALTGAIIVGYWTFFLWNLFT